MKYVILIDFGSTFTKMAVVSVNDSKLVYTTKAASTVSSNAMICLEQCMENVASVIGRRAIKESMTLASSSAAGGLRMAVCGLTPSLSVTVGRNVTFGAGAKVVHVTAGILNDSDLAQMEASRVEIILLCGGYENGCERSLLHNTEVLAASKLSCPIIFAGNSRVAGRFREVMSLSKHEYYTVANVMPQIGDINPAQAIDTVRNLFMQRIIDMKGLGCVRDRLKNNLIPTPAAVLNAGELLARGSSRYPGLGNLMILDIGGATTDVHSFAASQTKTGTRIIGAAEPFAKRTVEGDLGMRESSDTLSHEIGHEKLASSIPMTMTEVSNAIRNRVQQTSYVPKSDAQIRFDQELAKNAARVASRRHAGRIEHLVASTNRTVQRGKNLTAVDKIIGTGGVIVNSYNPKDILKEMLCDSTLEPDVLLPQHASLHVDTSYMLFAVGLLREFDDDFAMEVMQNCIIGS